MYTLDLLPSEIALSIHCLWSIFSVVNVKAKRLHMQSLRCHQDQARQKTSDRAYEVRSIWTFPWECGLNKWRLAIFLWMTPVAMHLIRERWGSLSAHPGRQHNSDTETSWESGKLLLNKSSSRWLTSYAWMSGIITHWQENNYWNWLINQYVICCLNYVANMFSWEPPNGWLMVNSNRWWFRLASLSCSLIGCLQSHGGTLTGKMNCYYSPSAIDGFLLLWLVEHYW